MKKQLSENEIVLLMVFSALILGGLLRFTPPALAGFPVNDGGLFATMIADLGHHHYLLPAFTSYNGASIPFVYPPFGLYMARIIVDLFHVSTLQVLTWLPAAISLVTILAFYLFASELLESRTQAAIATVIFAISPRSFSWFIMGGGLTRSFGMLGLILTLYAAQKLFKEATPKHLMLTVLCGSLAVLSHPEAIVHTVAAAVLLWLLTARSRKTFFSALQVCAGVIVLTSPWWATVLYQHGPGPLINGSQTGFPTLVFAIIPFYFTEESMMTLITVLGLIGLFAEVNRKKYFLPALIFVAFIVEARSAAWVANIALALLGAIALDKIILPGLAAIKKQENLSVYGSVTSRVLLGYIFLYIFGSTYLYSLAESSVHLDNQQREAMTWVENNTAPESQFILLTPGSDYPMRDPIQEWFPALTKRISLTTLQGREWTLGPKFGDSFAIYKELQACVHQEDITCISTQMSNIGGSFGYIYVNKKSNYQLGAAWSNDGYNPKLIESALQSGKFILAYENQSVVILKAK